MKKETKTEIKLWIALGFILTIILLATCSCSSGNKLHNEIQVTTRYCGKLLNVTQVSKNLALVKTDKVEFIVYGIPDRSKNTYCYVKYENIRAMPTNEVRLIPYLVFNDCYESYRFYGNMLDYDLHRDIVFIDAENITFN